MISVLHIASKYLRALEADDVGADTMVKSFIKAYMNHAKTDVPSNLVSILRKIHIGDKKNPALKGTEDFPGIDKAVTDAFAAVKDIEYDSKFLNRYHFESNEEVQAVLVLDAFLNAFHSNLAFKMKGSLSTNIPVLENLFRQVSLIESRIPIGAIGDKKIRYQDGIKKAQKVFEGVAIPEHYGKGYKPPEEKPAEKSEPGKTKLKVQIPLDLKKKPGVPPAKPSPKPGVKTVPLNLKVPPAPAVPLKPTPRRPIPAPAPTPQAKPPRGPGVKTVPLEGIKPAPKAPAAPKPAPVKKAPVKKAPATPVKPTVPEKKAPAAPVKKAPAAPVKKAPVKKTPTKEPEELSTHERDTVGDLYEELKDLSKPKMDKFKEHLKEMEVGQALKDLPWGSDKLTLKEVHDALKHTKDRDKALDEFKDFFYFDLA